MSVTDVMLGIEKRLQTISGLRTSATIPGQINPPQAIVGVPPISDFQVSFGRGKYDLAPTITVLTSSAWDRTGQLALAEYYKSIPAAIADDPRLGGSVESAQVTDARALSMEEFGVIQYFGGVFTLRVMATFT